MKLSFLALIGALGCCMSVLAMEKNAQKLLTAVKATSLDLPHIQKLACLCSAREVSDACINLEKRLAKVRKMDSELTKHFGEKYYSTLSNHDHLKTTIRTMEQAVGILRK